MNDDPIAPKRIQLRRTKGWRKSPNTVVVARPTQWGNPFRASRTVSRDSAVQSFNVHVIRQRIHPFTTERIRAELAGKNLACWCPLDEPCHADILLRIANEEPEPQPARNTG